MLIDNLVDSKAAAGNSCIVRLRCYIGLFVVMVAVVVVGML